MTGRTFDLEDVTAFDLAISFGLDEDDFLRFMERAHADEVLDSIVPRAGVESVLHEWRGVGLGLEVVTGRPPSTGAVTRRWLARCGIPHDSVEFVDKYGRPDWRGGSEVATPMAELGRRQHYVLAVEDSLEMAQFLVERLDVTVALLDRPWNRETGALPGAVLSRVHRCAGWEEIAERFSEPLA